MGVEDRHLEGGLGHRMPVQLGEDRRNVGGLDRPGGEQPGQEVMDHHVLRTVDVLRRVAGLRECNALAPALDGAAGRVGQLDAHEQDVTIGLAPEARAERGDERHRDPAELDMFDGPCVHGADPIT